MNQKIHKISEKLTSPMIRQEINLLRSALMSVIGEDKEGNYHPQLVREILRAAREAPQRQFHNAKDFLAELANV